MLHAFAVRGFSTNGAVVHGHGPCTQDEALDDISRGRFRQPATRFCNSPAL